MRAVLIVFLLLFIAPTADIKGYQHTSTAKDTTMRDEVYRKIYKLGFKGNYVITGEAKPKNSTLFYTVEDGHVQFIREKKVEVHGKPRKWHPFKIIINIPDTALPDNGSVVLTLYERNANGKMIHSYPIILEQFYH